MPAEMIYAEKTEQVWRRLPARIRVEDADAGGGLKLLASLLGDATDNVRALLARFTYLPGADRATAELRELLGPDLGASSDLVDPDRADADWLPWLAQLPGVHVTRAMSELAQRDAIEGAVTGWAAGTRDSIADAARTALVGTRYVAVHDHSLTAVGDGGRWDVLLITRTSETPDVVAVLEAVRAANAEPSGVLLHHLAYTATWGDVDAAFPTWADRNGLTWSQVQEAGL